MIKSIIFLMAVLILSSCARYEWVDLNKCDEQVESYAKCKVVK